MPSEILEQSVYDSPLLAWLVLKDIIFFFTPLLVLCILLSTILCTNSIIRLVRRPSRTSKVHLEQKFFTFLSFSIVGTVIGLVVNLSGGFGLTDNAETDNFKSIGSMLAAFSALAALFLGELKLRSVQSIRPVGTAVAVFMMLIGHLFLSEVDARLGKSSAGDALKFLTPAAMEKE